MNCVQRAEFGRHRLRSGLEDYRINLDKFKGVKKGKYCRATSMSDNCATKRTRSKVRRLSVLTNVLDIPRSICRHSGNGLGCPSATRSSTEASM